jgi:hypothetical protein
MRRPRSLKPAQIDGQAQYSQHQKIPPVSALGGIDASRLTQEQGDSDGQERIQREPTPAEHARPAGQQQIRNRQRRRAHEPRPNGQCAHARGREIRKERHSQIRNQREQRGNDVHGSDEGHFLHCALCGGSGS